MSTMSAATAALALALGLAAFVAGAAAQSGPQTCPAQCTCSCPSPRPPSPFPPPPKSPSPKPPSPKPSPPPPSPKPSPKPPARAPPPPPPLTPPARCNFNNIRSLTKCNQRTTNVPYELDDDFNCAPRRESGRDYLGCTFTIQPKSCPAADGDCKPLVPRSFYLLADQATCRSKIDKVVLTFPNGTSEIKSGHWEGETCLRKYSLTTSPAGVPVGSNVTVLFPARGECSDPLEVCRPGKIDGANVCKAAVADYEFEFCAFKEIEKA